MSQEKKPDPNPDHGHDDEHGHGGRKPPITHSAPMPLRQLTELDFEFWHNITKL